MSVDSVLDGALSTLLEKARHGQSAAQAAAAGSAVRPATINFNWGGGGSALNALQCDPLLYEVPFPATIVSAHLFAGNALGQPVAVSVNLELVLTNVLTFGSSTPLSGTGSQPNMVAESANNANITGWQTNLIAGDAIIGRITAYLGAATWLALVIQISPSEVPIGITTLTDSAGVTMVDSAGNFIVSRG